MLNCGITGLWAHRALEPANLGYVSQLGWDVSMHGTWNPAFWSRNATKSKKFTN